MSGRQCLSGGTQSLGDSEHRGKPSLIRIEQVTKRFDGFTAVDALSLEIVEQEFFALLGPSGCGKTTLLRMLAGFERPDQGRIFLDGQDITDVPPYRRPVNLMFQSYALFPHLSVEKNIAFGLRREGLPGAEIAARVADMLALVRLDGFGNRKPAHLSGGQKQRVALARALAKRPRLLLLDEPLAALDKKLRQETQLELREIQHRLGLTFLIVTHDQDEAMTLADRIGVMNGGRLVQIGTPVDIYEAPNARFVAEFIGNINIFEAVVESVSQTRTTLKSGDITHASALTDCDLHLSPGQAVALAVRPEKMVLKPASSTENVEENSAEGMVVDIAYLGDLTRFLLKMPGGKLVHVARHNVRRGVPEFARNDRVRVSFPADASMILRG